jgi:hypothetical protein
MKRRKTMKKIDEYVLVSEFPSLYKDIGKSPRESCMAFGLEVGDGWYDIIYKLSEKLEPMGVVASQVKEKYGTLRFYIYNATDEAYDLCDAAESESETTCELCGEPGKLRGKGWITTRCEECYNDDQKS